MPKPAWLRGKRKRSATQRAIEEGYRSGLEKLNSTFLEKQGCPFEYEPGDKKIKYVVPAQEHSYLPDFVLWNGIIVETKGRFESADRKKHLLIQAQYPDLDIRFVFSNSNAPIYKGSPTSCAKWCEKHGFIWAAKCIPIAWLHEKPRRYVRHDEQDKDGVRRNATKGICIELPARRANSDECYHVG